jgi:hypothetical protein
MVLGRERTISTTMIRRLLAVLETSSLHPHVLLELECDLLALLPPLEPVMSASRRRRRGRARARRATKEKRGAETHGKGASIRPRGGFRVLCDSAGSTEGYARVTGGPAKSVRSKATPCFGPTKHPTVCYDLGVSSACLEDGHMGGREDRTPKGSRA